MIPTFTNGGGLLLILLVLSVALAAVVDRCAR